MLSIMTCSRHIYILCHGIDAPQEEIRKRIYKITGITPDGLHRQDLVLKVREKEAFATREANVFRELASTYDESELMHIPKLLDVSGRYVVTECVGQRLDRARLDTPEQLFSFLHALATVVHRFHSNGWAMLDVKESNFTVPEDTLDNQSLIDHCWFVDAELSHRFGDQIKGKPGEHQ